MPNTGRREAAVNTGIMKDTIDVIQAFTQKYQNSPRLTSIHPKRQTGSLIPISIHKHVLTNTRLSKLLSGRQGWYHQF